MKKAVTKREAQAAFTVLYRYAWPELFTLGVEQALEMVALVLDLRLPSPRVLKAGRTKR